MNEKLLRELKNARERANISQGEMAKRLGTKQSVVSAIECGKRKLSFNMLDRFADILGERFRPQVPKF